MNISHPHPDPIRAGIARELAAFYSELAATEAREPEPRFSLARVLEQMRTTRGLADGYEGEVCSSAALINGSTYDAHRVIVPLGALATRDLSTANSGAYLVGAATAEPFDVLRPYSVAVESGITTLSGLRENLAIPRASTAASAGWVPQDGVSEYAESQPAVGAVYLTPKVAACWLDFSHQMRSQGASLEMFLRQQLLGAVGELVDAAIFAGTGVDGEPRGLVGLSGVNTATGTSLAHAGLLEMRQEVLDAGGRAERLQWVGAPAVQALLGARERVAGGGRHLWDDEGILGRPAHATKTAPAATLIAGDFSTAVLALWGVGVRVEVDPFTAFATGVTRARVVLDVDVAFPRPEAFSVASSIT